MGIFDKLFGKRKPREKLPPRPVFEPWVEPPPWREPEPPPPTEAEIRAQEAYDAQLYRFVLAMETLATMRLIALANPDPTDKAQAIATMQNARQTILAQFGEEGLQRVYELCLQSRAWIIQPMLDRHLMGREAKG